jgi:hypothetical protein
MFRPLCMDMIELAGDAKNRKDVRAATTAASTHREPLFLTETRKVGRIKSLLDQLEIDLMSLPPIGKSGTVGKSSKKEGRLLSTASMDSSVATPATAAPTAASLLATSASPAATPSSVKAGRPPPVDIAGLTALDAASIEIKVGELAGGFCYLFCFGGGCVVSSWQIVRRHLACFKSYHCFQRTNLSPIRARLVKTRKRSTSSMM